MLPVAIADDNEPHILPSRTCLAAAGLRHFVVENARTARRALKAMGHPVAVQELAIVELPSLKESGPLTDAVIADLLAPLIQGHSVGMLSESGCPGIADPGAALADWAQRHGYRVIPHVGPSSVLLALMASGLEGQRFTFHGYLPVEANARATAIKVLEQRSGHNRAAEIFIETPYRNAPLLEALLVTLQPATRLAIASDLTGTQESLRTQSISEWRRKPPELPRVPTVFIVQAAVASVTPPPARASAAQRRPGARTPSRQRRS
jgi:16S rRNA (cytidine1402-2'-O)-methyltransferase